MAATGELIELRCDALKADGHTCHKLLMKVSSTSSALIQAKCTRCAAVTSFRVGQATDRRVVLRA